MADQERLEMLETLAILVAELVEREEPQLAVQARLETLAKLVERQVEQAVLGTAYDPSGQPR